MVKRYDESINDCLYEIADGQYVKFDDYDALAARLRGLIVAICEAQEEGGDVALAIDEAGRAVARPANSAGDAT